MRDFQIRAIDDVKEVSNSLLYYGEEASATVMEVYYRIIESDDEQEINNEVSKFREFVVKHNQKFLEWKTQQSETK